MIFLAIDAGSSSVKARLFKDAVPIGRAARVGYPTDCDGLKVQVQAEVLLRAVARAIGQVASHRAEVIGLSVMSPAWVAMDRRGRAVTPIVTHQDRRAMAEAAAIEKRVGKARHLALAGNRPFPGSISSTTCAWFLAHGKAAMARADLAGHLNTFLHRQLTGARVIDPSNASFTGLYLTCRQEGWSDELCAAVGISRSLLPEILPSDAVAGKVTAEAAARFGLKSGAPVLAGMVDTSAAAMLTPARAGQLVNTCGSTDVLGVVTDKARPHDLLLTRALGVGRKWLSVATLAAAGSSLDWMRREFFGDLTEASFHKLAARISTERRRTAVRFDPYLAGERSSMDQKQAAFAGLTLATTREDLLASVIQALHAISAARLPLLRQVQPRLLRRVLVTGGGGMLQRDWPGQWEFNHVTEASLAGLAALTEPGSVSSVGSAQ